MLIFDFLGIPDEQGKRALCWKLLLNYLPEERSKWKGVLNSKRELYRQFIGSKITNTFFNFSTFTLPVVILLDEMIVMPGAKEVDGDVTLSDHPLSLSPDSQWQAYFKDNEVLLQIDKDVRRLCPDISFFQQPTEFPCSKIVNSDDVKRLHSRVQCSVLNCANVERKGLGITKVNIVKILNVLYLMCTFLCCLV